MALVRATGIVGSGTLMSRALGFVRDMVIARTFDVGGATDAFFVAFRIPNFLRRLFAEGSFSLAFVPVFAEYYQRGDRRALKELLDAVTGALLAALLVVTGLGILGAGIVITIFAPGFVDDPQRFELARDLLRVTFPYLLFISLTALAGGVLNTLGRFFVPAVTPVLLNIALIAAALVWSPCFAEPVTALAWGIFVAGIGQLLLQIPILSRLGVLPRPRWRPGHAGVRRIARLMVPTLIGSSVAQINLLLDTLLASLLISGSVTWLYYADRLLEFPLGVFGVALSTVILPVLSRSYAANDGEGGRRTLAWALRWAALISLPAGVGLGLLAAAILTALFAYGAFTADDARYAAWALSAYAGGLPAFILIKALAPAYYARQDTRAPVRIAIVAMVTNMVLNVIFITVAAGYLQSAWPQSGGQWLSMVAATPGVHAALALASAVSGWLNAALLWRGLRRRELIPPPSDWWPVAWRSLLAAFIMALALLLLSQWWWPRAVDPAWLRILALFSLVAAGASVYFVVLWILALPWALLRTPTQTDSPRTSASGSAKVGVEK